MVLAGGRWPPIVVTLAMIVFVALVAGLVAGCRTETSPGSVDRTVLIDGSCEGGRPLDDAVDFPIRLRAKDNSLGYIRVRRDSAWAEEDLSNVLGTVPCGTTLWGHGPIKNYEYGVGYVVAARDARGRRCLGYISNSVVEVLPEQ
jgi:hypothetical protein